MTIERRTASPGPCPNATPTTQRALFAGRRLGAVLAGVFLSLAGCGGSVDNPATEGEQKLSFNFFQKCVEPVLEAQLSIPGTSLTNTCAAGGCHNNISGSGGALRIVPGAATATLTAKPDPNATPDIYRNFLSVQGQVLFSDPTQSRLVAKPLVRGVLHGGGRIFADENDPNVQLLLYWMSHPAAQGQDEFSAPEPATCSIS